MPEKKDQRKQNTILISQSYQTKELSKAQQNMKSFSKLISEKSIRPDYSTLQKYSPKIIKVKRTSTELIDLVAVRLERIEKTKKQKKNWRTEDMEILFWTLAHYCALYSKSSVQLLDLNDWQRISDCIPGSTAKECMFKILGLRIVHLADCHFTEHQNELLKQLVQSQGNPKITKWKVISQELYMKNREKKRIYRTPKQCKQHWFSFLSSQSKKTPWNEKQDRKLMTEVYKHNGIGRWAQIAKDFEGRSDNALKNRFGLLMKRLKKKYRTENSFLVIEKYLKSKNFSQKPIKRLSLQNIKLDNTKDAVIFSSNQEDNGNKDKIDEQKNFTKIQQPELLNQGQLLFSSSNNFWESSFNRMYLAFPMTSPYIAYFVSPTHLSLSVLE